MVKNGGYKDNREPCNGKLLGMEEACAKLGLAKWTLYGWVSQRKIAYIKIGRLTKFRPEDLESFIKNNRISAIEDLN